MGLEHFEYFEGLDKKWYWRVVAENGKIVADGSEGYNQKHDCLDAIDRFRKYNLLTAEVRLV